MNTITLAAVICATVATTGFMVVCGLIARNTGRKPAATYLCAWCQRHLRPSQGAWTRLQPSYWVCHGCAAAQGISTEDGP